MPTMFTCRPPAVNQSNALVPESMKGRSARLATLPARATYFACPLFLSNIITSIAVSRGSKSVNGSNLPLQL